MGKFMPVSGNPEQKIPMMVSDFSGGANVMYSDDLVKDSEFRNLINFDLESQGDLSIRKGFGYSKALSELMFIANMTISDFPFMTKTSSPTQEIILFKLLKNDNNAWKELSESPDLVTYQLARGSLNNTIKILIVAKMTGGVIKCFLKTYVIGLLSVTRTTITGDLPCSFTGGSNLMNVLHGEQYNKLFFTSNDKGMVVFNLKTDTFSYVGNFTGQTNSAYKPHGIEVRKLGFNILGSDPLTWINNSALVTPSIQGVYLTTTDRIPLNTAPAGKQFQLNIIYTGTVSDFTVSFSELESVISANLSVNSTYSTSGIKVYDIEFTTQPSKEVEITIKFSDVSIALDAYIDTYQIGDVDPSATTVSSLNLGNFKVIPMYDRLVYYTGNILWFSEINRFDYIPNFNFVLFPISNTDEIVKIVYFRTNYIIFTKQKIFKLSGAFETSELSLDLVNDNIGCISPNSVTMVGNELFFMSTQGLRSLRNDAFQVDLQNLRQFDEKVYPMIPNLNNSYGFTYKDQYVLMLNNRGAVGTVTVNNRVMTIPDTVRYYNLINAFVFDKYPTNDYPRFIHFDAGQMYSFMSTYDGISFFTGKAYKFGEDYKDFDDAYTASLETSGLNMGYPSHLKKFKYIVLKCGGKAYLHTLALKVYGDGSLLYDTSVVADAPQSDLALENARFEIDKLRLPSKCKNIAITISTPSTLGMTILNMTYVFKLGKIKE